MTEGYHGHQYGDDNQEAALDFLDRFNGAGMIPVPLIEDELIVNDVRLP